MRYTKFEIKNFKGINELVLDFAKLPQGKIFPLVGLNESGKTTILEAINLFQSPVESGKEHEMIHKKNRGIFNDDIQIKATLELEQSDKDIIKDFLNDKKLVAKEGINNIVITVKYQFKNSNFVENGFKTTWYLPLSVKTKKRQDFVDFYQGYETHWKELVGKLKEFLPNILYFENFLFEFPDKIYLEEVDNSEETKTTAQKEYRKIVQDILSSMNKSYKLNEHILNRLKNQSDANEEAVKQILNEMSKKLNDVIVQSWGEIFNQATEQKIEVEYSNNTSGHYLQFKVKEGASSFKIDERSLGFRWFFGFLIFTEFRKARQDENGEYLFLFDEPASNLHQGTQQKLLELFEKLTDKSKIIYSTHSHYLLKPKFLLNTFVVQDIGRRTGEDGEINLDNHSQDIKAELYKNFVANNQGQETHFQPILDCLEYVENPFKQDNNIIFTEGKFDYYTFKWVKEKFFINARYDFNFYPGNGVDKYENIFREYLGNNKKFIAVFDADRAGKKAKTDYLKNVSEELSKNIFVLKEIKDNFEDFQTESLFHTPAERLRIQKISFPDSTEYEKSKFNTAIQELFIKNDSFGLLQTTKNNFKAVFDFVQTKLNELN